MHFKSNVKFENYYTEIRLYFKNYLSNFNLLKYDKILVNLKICNFSKQLSVNLPTVSTSKFLHKNFSFISYLLNITITLERCFWIRLQSVFRFVSQSCQIHLLNLFDLTNNNNNLEVFEPFYRQYICSSFVQDFFKNHIEDEWVHDDCPKKFSEAIISFNEFYSSYAKSINQLYSRKFEMYSKKIKFFFMGEKNEAKNNFIVWLINLLNNPTNSLLFILFPELKIFVEKIINVRDFLGFYARFHFFFTLLVLKLNYNLPRIKYEIYILKSKQNYKIIESKFFNLLILEFRCMICIFGTTVLTEKIYVNLLFFKSYISFIRLHIPKITKCLFVDDFYDLNACTYLESLLSVEFKPIGSLKLSSESEFSKIPKCRITAINQKLIVCKRDFSKEFCVQIY
ncbi:hypothetical protein TUBRATIS_18610 [Tubulinosema ratisbonensis]|uniref:Uncharacterized protein n=1 Tax=Tubulinosema ratisbonensis TaxID=291195 RepID=A0A437AKZ5_9MICR|nr:hypothetical protein TUBRATIS_18610 [Tubulinosema ratisbonensis]